MTRMTPSGKLLGLKKVRVEENGNALAPDAVVDIKSEIYIYLECECSAVKDRSQSYIPLCCRHIVIVTQQLDFIHRAISALAAIQRRLMICHVDYGFPLDVLYTLSPFSPVTFSTDEKPYQHARIHFFDVNAAQPGGMA